jgi:uncharacterized protein YgiB involved in biofilm formation
MTTNGKRRRRSAYVGFSVLSLSAATLAGCDDSPVRDPDAKDAPIYASVAECEREHPAKDCEDGWQAAQSEHTATAPVFHNRAECEAEWGPGRCEAASGPSAAGMFVPAIAGFMLMNSLRQAQQPCDPRYNAYCGGYGGYGGGHAVYIGSGGRVYAGSEPVGDAQRTANGGFRAPRSVPVVEGPGGKVSAGVTRGGFGRMFGRFGGGRGG